ncbi:hypothetical protein VFPFJ_04976 [Purpureocillium lilacinum]|uniref:Uncharacterized protein n=1 Tax=Purpureocillium lilacinum TaxID=33203 RepID=A0A179H3F3_PURLI|nr:hypothetical protein VFPFJ_04976 [Purpureocillium lilacinum]OAQ84031.1 hypothetical protein VFPBJ_02799 [Purpureocillium lilacinum]OAQ90817.1 hypothetical protein VFPFJ_04976 [Purpureocillium lilacinum]
MLAPSLQCLPLLILDHISRRQPLASSLCRTNRSPIFTQRILPPLRRCPPPIHPAQDPGFRSHNGVSSARQTPPSRPTKEPGPTAAAARQGPHTGRALEDRCRPKQIYALYSREPLLCRASLPVPVRPCSSFPSRRQRLALAFNPLAFSLVHH